MFTKIQKNELPEPLQYALKRLNYRKKSASVSELESVTCSGTYWDGGSIRSYYTVNSNGEVNPIITPSAPPQFGGSAVPTVTVPKNGWIVSTGVFCGKTATAFIYGYKS